VHFPGIKSLVVYLFVVLFAASSVHADQTIQSVQQTLKDQGFYYGSVTGEKGAETTAAIRRYQIRNGLQVSGDINPETLRSFNMSWSPVSSAQPSGKSAATQSAKVLPDNSSRLGQHSPPPSSNQPDRPLEMNSNFNGGSYSSAQRRFSTRAAVAEVQRQLIAGGYYRGRIDGRYGRQTAVAMSAFQTASGFPSTGRLDMSTVDLLGLSSENFASLGSAPRAYENWVPVTKFKHGKWKVKWKKLHRKDGDEYGLEDRERDRGDSSRGEAHDD
jgi:peptidoglycan hydrolase-like protein with peptidoglycan-binding domain